MHDDNQRTRVWHTRRVARKAFDLVRRNDERLHLVRKNDLIKKREADGSNEGSHPSDLGYSFIARRLASIIEEKLR